MSADKDLASIHQMAPTKRGLGRQLLTTSVGAQLHFSFYPFPSSLFFSFLSLFPHLLPATTKESGRALKLPSGSWCSPEAKWHSVNFGLIRCFWCGQCLWQSHYCIIVYLCGPTGHKLKICSYSLQPFQVNWLVLKFKTISRDLDRAPFLSYFYYFSCRGQLCFTGREHVPEGWKGRREPISRQMKHSDSRRKPGLHGTPTPHRWLHLRWLQLDHLSSLLQQLSSSYAYVDVPL